MKKWLIALAAIGLVAAAGGYSYADRMGAFDPEPVLAQLRVGTAAPDFRLTDANGRAVSLADYRGRTVVLEWSNPECPTVRKHYDSGNMQRTQAAAAAAGIAWLTINSSGEGKQGHMTAEEARDFTAGQPSRRTAYLLDPDGAVGRRYGATATPHMFVIDAAGSLVYNGAIDDRPTQDAADIPGARNHVLAALSELRAGRPVSVPTTRPYGCSVKYAPV
jgi:peroxiredoxin